VHLSGKVARMIFIDPKQLNEVNLRRVLPHYVICSIRGTVAHDYPSQRAFGLTDYRSHQCLDISLFVVGGCH
jgi:hypothetical protein